MTLDLGIVMADAYVLSDHARQRIIERGIRESRVERILATSDRKWRDEEDPDLCHAEKRARDFGERLIHEVYNGIGVPAFVVTVYKRKE